VAATTLTLQDAWTGQTSAVTVDASQTLAMGANNYTNTGATTVNGTMTGSGTTIYTGTLTMGAGADVSLGGDVTFTGAVTNTGTGVITFNGAAGQTITNTAA